MPVDPAAPEDVPAPADDELPVPPDHEEEPEDGR